MKRTIYKGVLMRWGVLTAWMCAFGLSGTAMSHAQETLLNISVREATVREVIELIKSQSDYTFVYNVEELSRRSRSLWGKCCGGVWTLRGTCTG